MKAVNHIIFFSKALEPNDLWLTLTVSWAHSVDIAFSGVFSVRIPPLDQIIPEI